MIKINTFWIYGTLFLIALTVLFFYLGLAEIFFSGPQGIHFMRQTDSLSFASQYFNNGFHFFKPQLYNLKNIGGYAACEFPITYYITALLYSLVGKKLFLLKLLHFLIVSTGVYFIFKLSYQLLKDYFYAALICLLLFTSTVFNYYSFNYLPDAPALGFIFIGWYFIFQYQSSKKEKTVIISFLFFILGSLIKVTYLINPLAVIGFSLFSVLFHKTGLMSSHVAKRIIIYGTAGVIIVVLWNAYVLIYNDLYESTSFVTRALPIWTLTKHNIHIGWDHISNYWYQSYFAVNTFRLFYITLLFTIIFHKKSDIRLSLVTLILFFGCLAYFILFYPQFRDHDYYFLAFFPFIVLTLINGIKTLQNISGNLYLHLSLKVLISVIVIAGINHSRMKLSERFDNANDIFSRIGFLIQENSEAIEKLNIREDSKFIVAPDFCQNGGLFFLDKMGWNIVHPEDISTDKINIFMKSGAEYLLLATNVKQILEVGEAMGKLIFEGDGIRIYRLTHTKKN